MKARHIVSLMILSVAMVAFHPNVYAAPADLDGHWAQEEVEHLINQQVVSSEEAFQPNGVVTRGQAAVWLFNMVEDVTHVNGDNPYSDVKTTDPFYDDVRALSDAKILAGYPDGTFRPQEVVTRAQAVSMLSKAFGGELSYEQEAADYEDALEHWGKAAIQAMSESRIVDRSFGQHFRPDEGITRAEFAVMLARVDHPAFRAEEHGNTANNLQNDGRMARQGEWLYFSPIVNSTISPDASHLVRQHIDTKKYERLGDIVANDINVIGDQLYLIAMVSENPLNKEERLYRMNVDGSEPAEYTNLSGTPSQLTAIGEWLYFLESWEAKPTQLRRMKADGTALETLAEGVENYVLAKPYLFYEKDDQFHRMRMDGSEETELFSSKYHLAGMSENKLLLRDEASLYAADSTGQMDLIFDVKNEEERRLSAVNANDGTYYVGDWFGDLTMADLRLFSVTEREKRTRLEGIEPGDLYVFDHALYFGINGGDGNLPLAKMNKDGTLTELMPGL
ncbi:DUF5050 domain-containing protein [Bacillaceae bacterium SIJ1]|uniref:DUF5050 domain-containing protein n=1 Tax=Litoribacterium kuwaitense TaxID=1398745 RepID=UPI0013E9D2BC|nr:DUF5050 domain-containing protein [Litoribacterium kuwaitense]NGP44629.1 DUF5050 domain-containing protein [Litoribacterium kuwaitense]